jgi:alpha-maltose-1-phosphate synthase
MVAIFYRQDGYDMGSPRLMGRQAAGEGFLKGLFRHGATQKFYCVADQQPEFQEFGQRIRPWLRSDQTVQWLPESQPQRLVEAGVLYRPDAAVAKLAWQRRFFDQRNHSICGVTHTIASQETLQMIGDLLTAPVQSWDALICTSQAVKTAVEQLLGQWGDYLADRIGAKPSAAVQLPIIPLGVDLQAFDRAIDRPAQRQKLRQQFQIAPDDFVALYVGRLIFYAKAHPAPMYLALEKAAQATGRKVHLIQSGWFENQREEADFKAGMARFCPSVKAIFLDGRQPEYRMEQLTPIADVFISLADNIQETFGLTPIEAMAAGLSVIVSDWNGYKDTVRDGLDGFRIPTIVPETGDLGQSLAMRHYHNHWNYSTYIGHAAMLAAVDVNACAAAIQRLIESPELGRQLGANGRQRVQETYDWRVVIGQYEALWQDLNDRRVHGAEITAVKPGAAPQPLCDDPFRQFGHYPSQVLRSDTLLQAQTPYLQDFPQHLQNTWMTNFAADQRLPWPTIALLLQNLQQPQTVATMLDQLSEYPVTQVLSTLMYLIKFDVLAIVAPD